MKEVQSHLKYYVDKMQRWLINANIQIVWNTEWWNGRVFIPSLWVVRHGISTICDLKKKKNPSTLSTFQEYFVKLYRLRMYFRVECFMWPNIEFIMQKAHFSYSLGGKNPIMYSAEGPAATNIYRYLWFQMQSEVLTCTG